MKVYLCVNDGGYLELWTEAIEGDWAFTISHQFVWVYSGCEAIDAPPAFVGFTRTTLWFRNFPHPEECHREIIDSWIDASPTFAPYENEAKENE